MRRREAEQPGPPGHDQHVRDGRCGQPARRVGPAAREASGGRLDARWVWHWPPILALHMRLDLPARRALRTYSRSRLEEICAARGHSDRADAIAHHDERTERAAEALAVLTGLGLAALLGVAAAPRRAPA